MLSEDEDTQRFHVKVTIGPYSLQALTGRINYDQEDRGLTFSSGEKGGTGMPAMMALGAGAAVAGTLEALRKFINPSLPEGAMLPDVTVDFVPVDQETDAVTGLEDPFAGTVERSEEDAIDEAEDRAEERAIGDLNGEGVEL